MRSRLTVAVALLSISLCAAAAQGQSQTTALISPMAARPLGLMRMWTTHINLNRGRGRLVGMQLHVSASETHTVYEVTLGDKRFVFSERDKNTFGELIKVEGAKQKAEEKLAALTKELEDAGKKEGPQPAIELHVVPSMTLYATSDDGMLQAIDAETGGTRWTASVGNPGFPTSAPAASDEFVGVCNGSTVYLFHAKDGALAWSKMCVSIPGAGPAVSQELIFVPMINGQIETVDVLDPARPLPLFKSTGRTMVQPALSFNSVAWPTDAGNLYVGMAHGLGMRFRLQANDAISSTPAFLPPDRLFATSLDGYIYCVNENRGNMLWRFSAGEPISQSPVALGERVYAITDRGTAFALDAASSAEIWTASGIRNFLAGTLKRLYCTDTRGNLVVLDSATGSRLGSLTGGRFDMPLMNTQTDRIFLASSTGLVECLRETNQLFPALHYWVQTKKASLPPKSQSPKASDKTEPASSPGADPFGTPAAPPAAAADPFAAPPAGADPFKTP